MTSTELKQLELDIIELTNGESKQNLPKWMDKNMTVDQMRRYFNVVERLLQTDRRSNAGLFLIHTCPYDIRWLALRETMNESESIVRNIAKCRKCGDVIESKYRHDYVSCSCGAIAVDGGHDYVKRSGNPEDFEEVE